MKYKLKHLSRFCCKPANETEFEAVKMAAELESMTYMRAFDSHKYVYYSETYRRLQVAYCHVDCNYREQIPVIDFIKKLRMSEEEAQALEDDRVMFDIGKNWAYIDGAKGIEAFDGHHFRVSEDGLTVTLHKGKK